MQIQIWLADPGYFARVTPSHGDTISWVAERPMSQRELINKLTEIGFHQQDMGDAFYEADPEWQFRPEDEK